MDCNENCTGFNKSGEVDAGNQHSHEIMLYFLCIIIVVLPGLTTNAFALAFIVKDVRKAIFPAIVLLFTLISSDLVAASFTGIHMGVSLFVAEKSYFICAPLSVLHTFFLLYSATLNAMMSIDRTLALCAPYFYKGKIHVCTWKTGCIFVAICTAIFALFPIIGLGDVTVKTYKNGKVIYKCSTFSYREEPREKLYGAIYGVVGCAIILTIVCGNSLVIHSIYKMRKRIVPVVNDLSSSTTEFVNGDTATLAQSSFEIAFAKLMGCLALVYLVCGTPMNVLILVELVKPVSNSVLKGMIHFLSGLSYSVDPIVYILIRKTTRRKIARYLRCRCVKHDGAALTST